MLIWVNGPFGGGKTVTAHELVRRLPGSAVCDPEHAGFGLHRMLPRALRGDFQDLPVWRQAVHDLLALADDRHDGVLVVPMTLVVPEYFDEIVGRLRDGGHDVRHFALLAQRETVLRRLRERGFGRAVQLVAGSAAPLHRDTFAVRRLDECLTALRGEQFAEHIWTDHHPVPRVAEQIATASGLRLLPDRDTRLAGWARRKWTGLRHIRFD